MIVVTGAYGFIGSCLVQHLIQAGHSDELVLVDDFSQIRKESNLKNKSVHRRIERKAFISWLEQHGQSVKFIYHLGARTDTVDPDPVIFNELNLHYSQQIWSLCSRFEIPLVYASSAATYGNGELGFEDSHDHVSKYQPLNEYARSKNRFDIWALQQSEAPKQWYGLKFFNVYGPNEYHKGRMASVIFHAFHQIQKTGQMKLFRSHRDDYADGHQKRDFISVMDVTKMCSFFMSNQVENGLYNIGTGKARTFLDLVTSTFVAMGLEPQISFIDTPIDIRDNYQYFTEAKMDKLQQAGYQQPTLSLEEGISNYVQNYLIPNRYF